jgi:hypothetical protein
VRFQKSRVCLGRRKVPGVDTRGVVSPFRQRVVESGPDADWRRRASEQIARDWSESRTHVGEAAKL